MEMQRTGLWQLWKQQDKLRAKKGVASWNLCDGIEYSFSVSIQVWKDSFSY